MEPLKYSKKITVLKWTFLLVTYTSLTITFFLGREIIASPVCWEPINGGNGHYYELVVTDTSLSWHDAKEKAANKTFVGVPGHLVTVTNSEEDHFLRENFYSLIGDEETGRPGPWAWIGLTDEIIEGNFEWITGEPFSYSNWYPGEPNNLFNDDFGMYWTRNGIWSWNDLPDFYPSYPRAYIVEFEPVLRTNCNSGLPWVPLILEQ